MSLIRPFNGVVPRKDLVEKVVSRPFDTYSADEVKAKLEDNPNSFLRVIRPDYAPRGPQVKGKELLKASRSTFHELLQGGALERNESPSFYIYRQIQGSYSHTGIVAAVEAKAYRDGRIKIHEQTLEAKEAKLKDYLKVVAINAEPVMFTFKSNTELDTLIQEFTLFSAPYANFEQDGKRHILWNVTKEEDVNRLQLVCDNIQNLYVADGHHRSASSVLLAEELGNQFPLTKLFMGILIPDHDLRLLEFNRLVKGIPDALISKLPAMLEQICSVKLIGKIARAPKAKQCMSLYVRGNWYALDFGPAQAHVLDANLLTEKVLTPLLGIEDLRNDQRIGFLSGLKGIKALQQEVDNGAYQAAFALFPVQMEQFFSFSDEGKIMPPKTTWFEPKLLNGLVIYDLEIDSE
jgi:uncharacterized protein (DUF1015 family)